MKVVFGLGNPGREYRRTRHNIGFLVLDTFAERHNVKLDQYNFQSLTGKLKINGEEVFLVKPLTYMNLVGSAIGDIYRNLNIKIKDIIVINDDADLEFGRIKIVRKGGDAGHLGVRSIIQNLGSEDFPRIRIGIGRPSQQIELKEYVLQEFTPKEWEMIKPVILKAAEATETIILKGIEEAMINYN
ncbi:aminoacyl-tRNA hydrolase [Candidatus Aerophobetes bacterium]|nr:aminoacyl-tRNA hydrolase [Candidatus Aerophobetes bacterium]